MPPSRSVIRPNVYTTFLSTPVGRAAMKTAAKYAVQGVRKLASSGKLKSGGRSAAAAAGKFVREERKYKSARRRLFKPKAKGNFSAQLVPGVYSGKFKKYSRKTTKVENFLKHGYVVTHEVAGTVEDPDIVGVAHSTYSWTWWAVTMASLFVRKLIYKAYGANPATCQELLGLSCQSFVLTYYDESDTLLSVTHTYNGAVDTIQSVAATFTPICQTAVTTSGQVRFIDFIVSSTDGNYDYRLSLDDMRIKIFVQSVMKIQNRTQSDAGTNLVDVVDNNPIVGYGVLCIGGVPQPRAGKTTFTTTPLDELDNNGFTSVTGTQLQSLDREPFRKINFTNGKAEKRLLLQPGSIRSSRITSYKQGYLNNVIKSIRVGRYTFGADVKIAPGKSEVFMFEEIINTGVDKVLKIAYEKQLHVCMDLIQGKKKAIRMESRVG